MRLHPLAAGHPARLSHPHLEPLARRTLAVVAVVAVVAATASFVWRSVDRTAEPAGPPSADAYFSTAGETPTAFPATMLGLGFLTLGDPLARAVDVLGEPVTSEGAMFGFAHQWVLGDGATFTVSAWDDGEIHALHVRVPEGSPARMAAHDGLVIGTSTVRELTDAWGAGFTETASVYDDYVVSYITCLGSAPVVIKVDQDGADGAVRWDEPVTSLLVAVADAAPGTEGCPGR